MRQYNDLKKMMDVAAGRRKGIPCVKKGEQSSMYFTESTEIGDIAIEDGCIAGIGGI